MALKSTYKMSVKLFKAAHVRSVYLSFHVTGIGLAYLFVDSLSFLDNVVKLLALDS